MTQAPLQSANRKKISRSFYSVSVAMKLLEDFTKMLVSYVGVDLCRTDVAVAKHTLYATQISTVHQKVSREAMTHSVRANVLGDASEASVAADNALNTP